MKSECIIRAIEKNRQTCGKFKMANSNSTLINFNSISSIRVVGKGSWTKREEFYVGKFKLESTGHTTKVVEKFLPKLEIFSRS